MVIREDKYFYAQIVGDFYDDSRMQYLESRPDGLMYSFFYTRLMLKSIKSAGRLRVSEKVAYNEQMLAKVTGMSQEIVGPAMELLQELGLVETAEDGTVIICDFDRLVVSESKWAEYKRKQRSREKEDVQELSKECPMDVRTASGHCPTETEIKTETETETETERKTERKTEGKSGRRAAHTLPTEKKEVRKYGSYGWVELTEEEHEQLLAELGEGELVRCISYIDESAQSTGNKNGWRDWALLLRRCSRENWGRPRENESTKQRSAAGSGRRENDGLIERYCGGESEGDSARQNLADMKAYLARLKARDDLPGAAG